MEAEIRVLQPRAKEDQGLPAATRSWERGKAPPTELLEGTNPADTLIPNSWPLKV